MDTDYTNSTPENLGNKMYEQVKEYEGGYDTIRFSQAFDQVARLYALHSASKKDAVTVHQQVSQDVGEVLFSWDSEKRRYTQLDEKVGKLSKELGWSEKRLEKEAEAWINRNIKERALDQVWIKNMAEDTLINHYRRAKRAD